MKDENWKMKDERWKINEEDEKLKVHKYFKIYMNFNF